MKKEFSLYEFAGIITPGVILLFFVNFILTKQHGLNVFELDNIGESLFLIIIAYGVGHILHSFGNLLESTLWLIFGGKPTKWATNPSKLSNLIFKNIDFDEINKLLFKRFGESENRDYGRSVYNFLFQRGLTNRIDLFNSNYSLFRGLCVSFLMISILAFFSYDNCWYGIIGLVLFLLSLYRMFRFSTLYAKEVYLTFLNVEKNPI